MHQSGRRVLILSGQALFAHALRSLIEGSAFQVVGVEPYNDVKATHIQNLQPDVIILDDMDLPPLLLPKLLDCFPSVRILRVMLEGNAVRVYDGHELNVDRAKDFLDALCLAEPNGLSAQA